MKVAKKVEYINYLIEEIAARLLGQTRMQAIKRQFDISVNTPEEPIKVEEDDE